MIENLPNEIWQNIPEFPNYKISNCKRIKKIKNNKKEQLLKPKMTESGQTYRLNKNGQRLYYVVSNYFIEDLPNEIWKNVLGYESRYSVSNKGRIKSKINDNYYKDSNSTTRYKLLLKLKKTKHGYLTIQLCGESGKKHFFVHRIVAIAFLDNPNNYPQVNHKNAKKEDNRVENLEWVTKNMNVKHACEMGLFWSPKGSNHYCAKLTEDQVIEIRKLYDNGATYKTIAEQFQKPYKQIWKIIKKQSWKHVSHETP